MKFNRIILIILDSVGIGAAPDAARFGDEKANTVKHIGDWCEQHKKDFKLPNLSQWGLGDLVKTFGLEQLNAQEIKASRCALIEASAGKDTSTGHWEMAGHIIHEQFPVFSDGFPSQFMDRWLNENKLPGFLGNCAASGTEIIKVHGEEHMQSGKPIVYTSADSVFQVACHEENFSLKKLYDVCISARKIFDEVGIGRIIARPFLGTNKDDFKRTENRRDYSVPPPEPNLLDILREQNYFVGGVGKIEDIFAHRSVNLVDHTGNNMDSLISTLKMMKDTKTQKGLIFTNLIDFDQLHGHRRNPKTYAEALMDFDQFLPQIEAAAQESDLILLSADHGNDPTHPGTDHTRENVPLLCWSPHPDFQARKLEPVNSFTSIAKLCLEALGLHNELNKIPDAEQSASIFEKVMRV